MKILKKGRPQRGWAKEFECTGAGNGGGGCGARLLVEEGDVFETSSSHYDGSTDYYITFECGCCHVLTDINGAYTGPRPIPKHRDWLANRID